MDLKPGEIRCDQCDGKGFIVNKYFGKPVCNKCNGTGKLDWVEAVVGKKNNLHPYEPEKGFTYLNTRDDNVYTYDGNRWNVVP